MLNLIEMMLENTMHIVRAEDLARVIPNDEYLVLGAPEQLPPARYGVLTFEACALYTKAGMVRVPAFIVKKGSGPYVWTKKVTGFVTAAEGQPVIFTNGSWDHTVFSKSLGANLVKKFPNISRKTMICVRNIKSGSPDRIIHDIFKVVEVMSNES